MTEPISADEIRRTTFGMGSRGEGYDEIEVDDFLDRVTQSMATGTFNPSITVGASFGRARGLGRRGYNAQEVDRMLSRIAATPPSAGGITSWSTTAAEQDGREPSEKAAGLFKRIFGKK